MAFGFSIEIGGGDVGFEGVGGLGGLGVLELCENTVV